MKTELYALLLFALVGCVKKKADVVTYAPPVAAKKILLLKVSYLNPVFEGGKELSLSNPAYFNDSLPIKVEYKPALDYGNLRLLYAPTNDTVFDGSVIWLGRGEMRYPAVLDSASTFATLNYQLSAPVSSRFQKILSSYPGTVINGDTIPWSAISKLQIVHDYLSTNKKIGYFIYTPSVGQGDPSQWSRFFVLSK